MTTEGTNGEESTFAIPSIGYKFDPDSEDYDWTTFASDLSRADRETAYAWAVIDPMTRSLRGRGYTNWVNPALGEHRLSTAHPGREYIFVREQDVTSQAYYLTEGCDRWWLGYDGVSSLEPVNQVPYLEGWLQGTDQREVNNDTYIPGDFVKGYEEHVCQFAFDLSRLPAHTVQHADKTRVHVLPLDPHDDSSNERWKWVWKYGRGVIGFCFQELEDWGKIPVTTTGVLSWQSRKTDWISHMMNWLCWQCPNPYWAVLMLLEMDPSEWETYLTPTLADGSYSVTIPRMDPETMSPKTGSLDYFVRSSTPRDPDVLWQGWIDGYNKALRRYIRKYAKRQIEE